MLKFDLRDKWAANSEKHPQAPRIFLVAAATSHCQARVLTLLLLWMLAAGGLDQIGG